MFSIWKKSNFQTNKYIKIIEDLRLKGKEDIKETADLLIEVYNQFNEYSIRQLKVSRTEVSTLVDDYKQNSLITSIISTLIAMVVLIINLMKDTLLVDMSDLTMNTIFFYLVMIMICVVLFPSILLIGSFAKKSRTLNQVLNIIDLVIKDREEMDKKHEEAYKDYCKHLNEGIPIT